MSALKKIFRLKTTSVLFFLALLLLGIGVFFMISGLFTSTPIPTLPIPTSITAKASCTENGGTWLDDYQECERISETTCTALNGTYDNCSSACRHDPKYPDIPCIKICVPVCRFSPEFP